ncbi:MAG: hypothetical protein ACTTKL_00380 [Treponema sp.]
MSEPDLSNSSGVSEWTAQEIEDFLARCKTAGEKVIFIRDTAFAKDKAAVLRFLRIAERAFPDAFFSIEIAPSALDAEICRAASFLSCSLELDFTLAGADGKTFFDKKLYSRRAALLNNASLVFGVHLFYADSDGDSLKAFCDRLDFTASLYPNHIDFEQTEISADETHPARVTALFSARDIRHARDIAFACRTFYSAGRAVPWFLPVLKPLKIQPSRFFADFAEWQRLGHCHFRSGFTPEDAPHSEIEKMQLSFLKIKYDEKRLSHLLAVVRNIVRLNGAFARLSGEGEECIIETDFSPDDLLSPESSDIAAFSNNVCMEKCAVKIFAGGDGPDYKIL